MSQPFHGPPKWYVVHWLKNPYAEDSAATKLPLKFFLDWLRFRSTNEIIYVIVERNNNLTMNTPWTRIRHKV